MSFEIEVLLVSFAISIILGIITIPILRKLKVGQIERDDGPASHLKKQGTPTMGGIIIIITMIIGTIATAVYLYATGESELATKLVPILLLTIGFGAIGFIDDYKKLVLKNTEGLKPSYKMLGLLIISVAYVLYLIEGLKLGTDTYIPITKQYITLPLYIYVPAAICVILGTTNAINLTDGIDGLSSSVSTIIITCLTVIGMLRGVTEVSVFGSIVIGSILGFLMFNLHPAKVFMGDTGSLLLGGVISGIALYLKMPLILLVIAFIPVVETLSVIIQVAYFKKTGKRIFKMAPLHHHFELSGWKENKVVIVFSIATLIVCMIGLKIKKRRNSKMAKKKTGKFSSFLNNPIDFTLLITIILLLGMGLVMVLSASSPSALAETGDSYRFFNKQLIFAVLGIFAMMAISKIDYRFYQKFYKQAWWLSAVLLVAVKLIGRKLNGAQRWIYITDALSFQPSEIVKFLVIVFYAGILVKNRDELPYFWKGLVKHICMVAPLIALLLLEPHFSASIVIIGIVCIMMIVAGCKFTQFLAVGGGIGIPAAVLLIVKSPYRLQRVVSFLDPWKDASDTGWQVIQSLYAIGSGGLFGVGLGDSKQKYLYIPEPHNDFIFSIVGEELGFVGCAIIIILFAIFIWRGILIAMRAPDMFGSLVAVGITSLVGIQVIINIAVVTSSMPATGMPLPFFSYRRNSIVYSFMPNGSNA